MPQVAQYIRSLLDAQSKVKLLDVITDGRTVIEQVRELQPDLLIVDALLQGKMNGLQVAMDIREAGLDLPIIALTVPTKPISIGEGMGSTRVLSMPFSGYDFMRLRPGAERRAPRAGARGLFARLSRSSAPRAASARPRSPTTSPRPSPREGQQRVALIDGSLQYGDLRALLRVDESAPSILQLPTNKVQKTDVEEVVYRDKSGVARAARAAAHRDVRDDPGARPREAASRCMRRLYNIVIIDTASQRRRHPARLPRCERRGRSRW